MKKLILAVAALTLLAGLAEGVVLVGARTGPFRVNIDPVALAALLESVALVLGAFVALTQPGFVEIIRHCAAKSASAALLTPFLLLIPYFLYAAGTHTFSPRACAKLTAYIAVPTLLLLPDRIHPAEKVGWRDFVAMAALAVPVGAHWLERIWTWPQELYFFQPLFCVCVGAYDFMAIRNLEGIGYRLGLERKDVLDALLNFAGFALLAIPLGLLLNFIHPHAGAASAPLFGLQLFGIYITIAIPEEFLFRGILQNFLVKSFSPGRYFYGLLIASVIFGAAHLHHAPVPNWRYGILATLAGAFYGNVYRTRQRLSASALTHSLVDTVWHFWF